MGQGTQPQVVPGVRIDTANIRGTTRYSDLQGDLQQQIEEFDKMIQAHMGWKEQIDGIVPKHQEGLDNLPESVELCRRQLIGAQNGMASDVESIANVQGLIKIDAENAQLSFKAIENLKLPQQYHIDDSWHSKSTNNRSQENRDDKSRSIVGFVSSTADELATTITKYKEHITEIELHLRGVEANSAQQINSLIARRNNGGSGADNDAVQDLAATLTDFEQSILHVAGKIGDVREGVQTLQLGSFTGVTNGKGVNGKRSGVY
jgi:nucleoporin p58/p45